MNRNINFANIRERQLFFRMLQKIRRCGFKEEELFTMSVDDLRKVDGITACNIFMILRLQEMYRKATKETLRNTNKECRILRS